MKKCQWTFQNVGVNNLAVNVNKHQNK